MGRTSRWGQRVDMCGTSIEGITEAIMRSAHMVATMRCDAQASCSASVTSVGTVAEF